MLMPISTFSQPNTKSVDANMLGTFNFQKFILIIENDESEKNGSITRDSIRCVPRPRTYHTIHETEEKITSKNLKKREANIRKRRSSLMITYDLN